jgi:hypothetical protein
MSIALSTHKVAAIAIGVAMVFSFAFVTPASAQTVADLTAQINSLLTTIASLQAQLAAMTGGGATGCYTFTQNYGQDDSGGEVMNVQKFLNMDAATRLASGADAGAPGYETNYFGVRTKAAVIKFQDKYTAEVLTPVGLTSGTGYWGPSSRAKANALEAARCAGGTPTTPGVPITGTVSVSAAAQPGNSLAPTNATNVPFTKFTISNGTNAAVTVNSVTVELGGLADKAAFSSVVLLDENGDQVGLTRVLNSNKQATIGEAVTLQPGQSRTFTVAANIGTISTTYAGQVAVFSVVSVNTTASISGSLPITGAAHTLNGSLSIGTVTVARGPLDPAADKTKEVGITGYTFSSLKMTAGSAEDIRVRSIRWNQSGSASSQDLANVVVEVDGVEYTPTVSSDGKYYLVNFGSGIVIAKGNSKEFSVKGDIVSGSGRTASFDIYKATDINITGETYGYGVGAVDTNTTDAGAEGTYDDDHTPAYDAYDVTISAGTVNAFSKSNKVSAGNVPEQVNDTVLGAFEFNLTGEGITINTMKFAIDTTGGVTDADDVTLITLVDQNGTVLAGPADGSATDYTPTSGTASEGSVSFSAVELPAGVTTIYVKGKLGSDFANTNTITIRANPADWSGATGASTGNSVTLPSGEVSANAQTVQAATLAARTLTDPAARSVVKGTTDFVWFTATLDAANSGEDIRVTAVGVLDTTTATATAADIDSFEIWADLNSSNSSRGDRFETLVASGDNFADTDAGDDETLAVTLDTVIIVPRNQSIDIAGIGDLSGSATGVSGTDTHTVDLDSVTAAGTNTGTSANVATGGSVTGTGQAMTVATNGTLTTSVDSSSPSAKLLLDDTVNEQTVAVFRLAANNVEDLDVDSIKITNEPATGGDVDAVSKYVFYHGATKLGEVTGGVAAAELFLADGTLTVPADDYVLVTVKAVMNNIDGTQVQNADTVQVTVNAAGDIDTTGKGSGQAVDSTGTNYDAAEHTVYEAYPTFAFDNTGVSTVLGASANYLVAKIVITNVGNKDIIFDGDDSLQINFEISGSLSTSVDAVFAVETVSGNTLDTVNMGALTGSTSADIVFATNTLTIPVGQSKEIQVRVNTGGLTTDGNTLQAWLSDDAAANMEFRIDGDATDYNEGDDVFKGDIYGPTHVNPS